MGDDKGRGRRHMERKRGDGREMQGELHSNRCIHYLWQERDGREVDKHIDRGAPREPN